MNYLVEMPLKSINGLIICLNKKIEEYTSTTQLFIIQYTYFELIDDVWIMKNFLDIGNNGATETLHQIYLRISKTETTNIIVYAQNRKFPSLIINKKLDMRGQSTDKIIYACDLYSDFVPEHFEGKCYTNHGGLAKA